MISFSNFFENVSPISFQSSLTHTPPPAAWDFPSFLFGRIPFASPGGIPLTIPASSGVTSVTPSSSSFFSPILSSSRLGEEYEIRMESESPGGTAGDVEGSEVGEENEEQEEEEERKGACVG